MENLITNPEDEQLEKEFREVLNRNSRENRSNTPDFMLAKYLVKCLRAYEDGVVSRDTWNGNR